MDLVDLQQRLEDVKASHTSYIQRLDDLPNRRINLKDNIKRVELRLNELKAELGSLDDEELSIKEDIAFAEARIKELEGMIENYTPFASVNSMSDFFGMIKLLAEGSGIDVDELLSDLKDSEREKEVDSVTEKAESVTALTVDDSKLYKGVFEKLDYFNAPSDSFEVPLLGNTVKRNKYYKNNDLLAVRVGNSYYKPIKYYKPYKSKIKGLYSILLYIAYVSGGFESTEEFCKVIRSFGESDRLYRGWLFRIGTADEDYCCFVGNDGKGLVRDETCDIPTVGVDTLWGNMKPLMSAIDGFKDLALKTSFIYGGSNNE